MNFKKQSMVVLGYFYYIKSRYRFKSPKLYIFFKVIIGLVIFNNKA